MNWKEEFIKLLKAERFETGCEIDEDADEHNWPAADGWRCCAEYTEDC